MKLRWSDGHSYAEVFHAVDEESLVANGLPALRIFRLATGRMVHRGDVHRNEFWGVAPELHLEIDGRWLSPGYIEKSDGSGPLGDVSFFKPFRVIFRHNTADTIEAMNERDAAQLATSAANWWRGVYDCWRWSGALDAMIMEVGDMLPGPGDDQ